MSRLNRQIVFLAAMTALSLGLASLFIWGMMYREGGIFDTGFASRMELKSLTSKGEEVIPGLPSTTIFIEANPKTQAADKPGFLLEEVGTLIRKAVANEESVSNQVTNVDFRGPMVTGSNHYKFRFNASTAVDYDEDTYFNTVKAFNNIVSTERFNSVNLESSPTPDGGRSVSMDLELKNMSSEPDAREFIDSWESSMISMNRIVEDMDNISRLTISDGNFRMSAEFYDQESLEQAMNLDIPVQRLVTAAIDSGVSENASVEVAEFSLSPISQDASSYSVTFIADYNQDKFKRATNEMKSYLTRQELLPAPWTTIFQVDGNPELREAVFGTSVTW